MSAPYTDLLLRIFPFDERSQAYPVEAELDDGSRFTGGQLRLDQEALLGQQLASEAYGLMLFQSLFPEHSDIRRAYDKATGAAEAKTDGRLRVRLWIDSEAIELHAIPWERLYHWHKGKNVPLGASALTPLSRYTSLEIREPQPVTDLPVRMLVALSNPENLPGGLAPANVDLEVENLRRSLDELRKNGQVKVTLMPGRTGLTPTLRAKLEGEGYTIIDGPTTLFNLAPQLLNTHVFHFIGHGAFRKSANGSGGGGGGTAALYLEKADGTWQAVKDDDIVSMLAALGTVPHLFFLVACESAKREAGATSPFVGLGPKLVQAGVPAVVAMQEQVPVEMARILSGEFYARLAEHGEVDRALNQARLQVFNAKSTDWAIPVLFMRIRKGRLFGADAEEDAPAPGVPPFKGLAYFTENDADKFYGRELLTAKLVGKLRTSRFLPIVIGASGSGKSSVIRAGVLPTLKRGEPLADGSLPPDGSRAWPTYVVTPGTNPLTQLAKELTRETVLDDPAAPETLLSDLSVDERSLHFYARKLLSQRQTSNRLLLIVDQFEEVFTLCKDEAERRAFINNLLYASAATTDGPTIVIIIFRADFYAHCAQYENLRTAVSTNQEFVGPMNMDELRRAIEEPAKAGHWEFEPGLVDLILQEVGDEPGALPLMQHALLETWKRRRGRTMTLRGYSDVGGIRGAIARTAENVYKELSAEQQTITRRVFLRLVELGEGTQDTRRRAKLAEIYLRPEMRALVDSVLNKLVENRLIVTGDDTVEVAHEALIREWPTLRRWVDESREGLRVHRELLDAAQTWEKVNRDDGALYRGVQLGRALEWAQSNEDEMGPQERDFLVVSQDAAEREAREREAQRQRELEAARQIAEEQKRAAAAAEKAAYAEKKRAEDQTRAAARQRVLSWIIGAVGVVAVILAIASLVAFGQANIASGKANAASTQAIHEQGIAQAASTQAIQQQGTAQAASTEAFVQKGNAEEQAATAQAASTLAVEQQNVAVEQAATAQAARAVADVERQNALYQRLLSEAIKNQETDPERTTLLILQALSQRGEVPEVEKYEAGNLLFAANQAQRARLTLGSVGQSPAMYSAAYSPSGNLIATVGEDTAISLWDAVTGELIRRIAENGHSALINTVTFSPDGKFIVTASKDKTAKLWNVESGDLVLDMAEHTDVVNSARFSRDGKQIITVGSDGQVLLWNITTGRVIDKLEDAGAAPSRVWEVAVSPNGRYFASVHADHIARVWDAITGAKVISLIGHHADVTAAAFSPDSLRLATASKDGELRLWSVGGLTQLIIPAHNDWIYSVAFSPDGRYIATASQDGTVKVWLATDGREVFRFTSHVREVYSVAFSPDGQSLLSAGLDGSARVWDVTNAGSRKFLELGRLPHEIYAVAISPDGQWVAAAGQDKLVELWNAETGEPNLIIHGHGDFIDTLAFSPDGTMLATGARDKVVRIFSLQTGQRIFIIPDGHLDRVTAVAFSPDGKLLASASADKKVKVWDIATGKLQLTLSHPNAVNSLAYSPDGTKIVTAYTANTATVWDATNGQKLFDVQDNTNAILYAVFSPDGAKIATAGEVATIHVWDANTGTEVFDHALIGQGGSLFGLQFSPDSRWLASAGTDRTLYLWDMETGDTRLTLFGPLGTIFSLAFHPDGHHIFTGGGDGAVHKFEVGIDILIESARAFVTRPLTAAECERYLLASTCPPSP